MHIEFYGYYGKSKIIFCLDHQAVDLFSLNLNYFMEKKVSFKFVREDFIINRLKSESVLDFFPLANDIIFQWWSGLNYVSKLVLKEIDAKANDEFYVYHDKVFLSKSLSKLNVTLIEDGYANYIYNSVKGGFTRKCLRFFAGYNPKKSIMGEKRYIRSILVTKPENIPIEIRGKCKRLPFNYQDFESEFAEAVKKLFNFEMTNISQDVFLTQGLDVAELCSLSEKMSLYKEVIYKLEAKKGTKLIIKLHPSEDYSAYKREFPDNTILKGDFPIEVFNFSNSKDINFYSLLTSSRIQNGNANRIRNLISKPNIWTEFNICKIKEHVLCNIELINND